MPVDVVKVACDASSLRSFMTYMVKRHDGSKRHASRLQECRDGAWGILGELVPDLSQGPSHPEAL